MVYNINMEKEIKNKVEKLIEQINYYSDLYYNQGISEISDAEFDRLYDEFLEYVEKYPEINNWENTPTKQVGSESTTEFVKFKHKSPMLSIDQKSKELEDLKKWYDKLEDKEVIVQPKFDGITVNVNYENKKFANAATRGNGVFGDLITEQFKNTDTKYPEEISSKELELRGEAIIPYDFFKKNKMDEVFSNPRNAVAGIMHSKDPAEIKNKGIKVIFYDIGLTDYKLSNKDSDNIDEIIKKNNFETSPYWICKNWEQLKECIETRIYGSIKDVDGFNILFADQCPQAMCDGIVIKSNSLSERAELGFTQKGPKFAFAYKLKSLQAKTTLENVEWQVGKSGRITPVAIFKEIKLGGTKITRATLNNIGYMSNLPTFEDGRINLEKTSALRSGDEILVERSNDVIPRIVAICKHNTEKVESIPTKCPVCGGKIVRENDLISCVNENCPAKVLSKIEHFASRDAMEITGLGEQIIERLNKIGVLNDVQDIYRLNEHREMLENLEGFGKKSVDNLLKSIEKSKTRDLDRFIYALSIPNVGRKMSKDLAEYYKSIENLINNFSYNQILSLESFGEVYAKGTTEWLSKIENIKLIKSLIKIGVKPKEIKGIELKSEKLKDKLFVITGTLSKPRKYFEELIKENGGKLGSDVSKNTDFLLAGEKAGSKLSKADKLGIKVIDEEEFKELLE